MFSKRISKKIKKLVKPSQVSSNAKKEEEDDIDENRRRYIQYVRRLPLEPKEIFLEPKNGAEIDGNLYYIAKYLLTSDKYKGYKVVIAAADPIAKAHMNSKITVFMKNWAAERSAEAQADESLPAAGDIPDAMVEDTVSSETASRAEKHLGPEKFAAFRMKSRLKMVTMGSDEYFRGLARAKFIISDGSIKNYFIKKDGQIYLNVWHGTPLKNMGRRIGHEPHATGNVQKNFVAADFLLYPNAYMREHMIEDYMIEDLAEHSTILMEGYPRNSVFFDDAGREKIREAEGLKDKKVYVYMPTWRPETMGMELRKILTEFDSGLTDEEVLYAKAHPLAADGVNYNGLTHVKPFPDDYEFLEFLNAADCLITDYSSVFYDYAVTGRKIVLYTYDEEDYLKTRGLYEPLDTLPFPRIRDVRGVIAELRREDTAENAAEYEKFRKRFCAYDGPDVPQRLCDRVILGIDTGIEELSMAEYASIGGVAGDRARRLSAADKDGMPGGTAAEGAEDVMDAEGGQAAGAADAADAADASLNAVSEKSLQASGQSAALTGSADAAPASSKARKKILIFAGELDPDRAVTKELMEFLQRTAGNQETEYYLTFHRKDLADHYDILHHLPEGVKYFGCAGKMVQTAEQKKARSSFKRGEISFAGYLRAVGDDYRMELRREYDRAKFDAYVIFHEMSAKRLLECSSMEGARRILVMARGEERLLPDGYDPVKMFDDIVENDKELEELLGYLASEEIEAYYAEYPERRNWYGRSIGENTGDAAADGSVVAAESTIAAGSAAAAGSTVAEGSATAEGNTVAEGSATAEGSIGEGAGDADAGQTSAAEGDDANKKSKDRKLASGNKVIAARRLTGASNIPRSDEVVCRIADQECSLTGSFLVLKGKIKIKGDSPFRTTGKIHIGTLTYEDAVSKTESKERTRKGKENGSGSNPVIEWKYGASAELNVNISAADLPLFDRNNRVEIELVITDEDTSEDKKAIETTSAGTVAPAETSTEADPAAATSAETAKAAMSNVESDQDAASESAKAEATTAVAAAPTETITAPVVERKVKSFLLSPRPMSSKKKQQVFIRKDLDFTCRFIERTKHFRVIIRGINVTDAPQELNKLIVASRLARVTGKLQDGKKRIVMFEKECSRYEENASVLFEALVDAGYTNVRFILDKDYPHRDKIDEKYRKYIVDRFSMAHYYNLFAAKCFITTETMGHALEKFNLSEPYRKYVQHGKHDYVFLQHGVTYMMSLDADLRQYYDFAANKGKSRVVVCSEKEAQHFLAYTKMKRKNLYVCGFPKFDRNKWNEDADKIVIMITWRPWEFNQGSASVETTSYYHMLQRMIEAVPEDLRDKLMVLPHPLVAAQVPEEQYERDFDPVWKYFNTSDKYDTILQSTKLLITDYSSITFDAFYRGANIIFDWSEKDKCVQHYGPKAHIMMTEEEAFGDVVYSEEELAEKIRAAYEGGQQQKYIDNYRQIVAFHDGKNTQRLIEMLKEDGII